MGECGCGETCVETAVRLPDGVIVGHDVYHGCPECFRGPAFAIYIYPNDKSEWLRHSKIEEFVPDEYGRNHRYVVSVGLFEVTDLRAAAAESCKEGGTIGRGRNQYANLDDWLDDFGLRMVQDAMSKFTQRMAELDKKKEKRK